VNDSLAIPAVTPMDAAGRLERRDEVSTRVPALTARMARGDEAAFREFFARYFDRLLRYLLVVTRGREELAREALQLTMLRVARHVRRFESEPVFWSWLTVLARCAAIDEQRRAQRYATLLGRFFREAPGSDTSGADETDAHLERSLAGSLTTLPDDERELLERKYLEGASVRDLAQELETTEKAVESRLVRVRRKLKQSLLAQLNREDTP